jgi:hypothetical protein
MPTRLVDRLLNAPSSQCAVHSPFPGARSPRNLHDGLRTSASRPQPSSSVRFELIRISRALLAPFRLSAFDPG